MQISSSGDEAPVFPCHKIILLLPRQLVIRLEDGEVGLLRPAAELRFPFAHLFSAPADHGSVVHAQGRVGDDQLFVDADDAAEPFAYGAGTDRRVERE